MPITSRSNDSKGYAGDSGGRHNVKLVPRPGSLLGTSLAAEPMKLPADFALEGAEGSPGKVTFRHASHVDPRKPACVVCHPRVFRILEAGKTSDGERVQHGQMENGRQCGLCHGKSAFGLDRCDACHGG